LSDTPGWANSYRTESLEDNWRRFL